MTLTVSIGYPAYNEEQNIANLLDSLLAQKLPDDVQLEEIIIVASGCRDSTVDIVKEYQQRNPVIRLFVEEMRRGLASAQNIILENARGEILITGCSDTQLEEHTIARLVEPLRRDQSVGAVVGKAVPLNNSKTLWGYIAHKSYEWNYQPEYLMVDFEGHTAMRKTLLGPMPLHAVYTERIADVMIRSKGYQVVHAPQAITYMKEPDNLNDFLKQKRRNIYMHLQQRREDIPAPHISLRKVIPTALRSIEPNPKKLLWLSTMLVLWGYSYILGWLDYKRKVSHLKVWREIPSSKGLPQSTAKVGNQ
ncbi:MAG: glycosyltransferase [Chloroflexi bacterium]|nr:glycosyltransferase [Chloroflexota bacterium]